MIRRILVPLDGSKLAEIALPYALELQDKFKADLILAWVLHPPIILSDYGTSAYGHALAVEKQIAQSYLTAMQIKCHQSEHPVRILLLNGPPADTIIDTACQACVDVIVMSTHGRSGLNRWVHGSVAAKVLAHAPCLSSWYKLKKRHPNSDCLLRCRPRCNYESCDYGRRLWITASTAYQYMS